MQIVIDMSEKYYNDICNSKTASNYSVLNALDGIRNGTPLPKGHGRLGDLDALEKEIEDYSEGAFAMTPEFLVKDALTIIEADKESEGR